MIRWRRATMLALAASSLTVSSPVQALCRTTTDDAPTFRNPGDCNDSGMPLFHADGCIPFGVSERGSVAQGITAEQAHAALLDAFAVWTGVECGEGTHPQLALADRGLLTCDLTEYQPGSALTNNNIVSFRDDGVGATVGPALTTVTFDANTGQILDVDIEVNSSAQFSDFDLRTVLAHEVGHGLGFEHSPEQGAMMAAALEPNETRASLTEDERLSLCETFGAGEQFECAPQKAGVDFTRECASPQRIEGSCESRVAAAPAPRMAWVGALLLVAVAGWRRSRTPGPLRDSSGVTHF